MIVKMINNKIKYVKCNNENDIIIIIIIIINNEK